MNNPIKHSFCVLPNHIYAGEYAGDLTNPQGKINQLVSFGITHFIDLTEIGELNPYAMLLPKGCVHHRFPIKDVSIPISHKDVLSLMEYISSIVKTPTNKVYIHCWGGVGRTGTIVACFYEFLGEDCEKAINHLRLSFQQCPKSHWRHTPQTTEQIEFIKSFEEYLKQQNSTKSLNPTIQMQEYTPERIVKLKSNEIFVFGSNLLGHHCSGAARMAKDKFGAIWGCGVGLQGQSYAIPTMQGGIETIKPYVDGFITFARSHPDLKFYVTRIGCGIAGFSME